MLFAALWAPAGLTAPSDLLQQVNERPLGRTQIRHTRMTLTAPTGEPRVYEIVALRSGSGSGVRSAFLIRSPESLRGTAFLMQETRPPRLDPGRVWIFLPAGERRVLEVEKDHLGEALLGSDFTFQDWRVWLPVEGMETSPFSTGTIACGGGACRSISVRPSSPDDARFLGWLHAVYEIDSDRHVVVGARFDETGDGRPERRFESAGWHRVDGVWLPTWMAMERPGSKRSTTVELLWAAHDLDIPDQMLEPESLPRLGDLIEARFGERLGPPLSTDRP